MKFLIATHSPAALHDNQKNPPKMAEDPVASSALWKTHSTTGRTHGSDKIWSDSNNES